MCHQSSTDTSFDSTMHEENIHNIKVAADRFLSECLVGKYDHLQGFKDSELYKVKPFEVKRDG